MHPRWRHETLVLFDRDQLDFKHLGALDSIYLRVCLPTDHLLGSFPTCDLMHVRFCQVHVQRTGHQADHYQMLYFYYYVMALAPLDLVLGQVVIVNLADAY